MIGKILVLAGLAGFLMAVSPQARSQPQSSQQDQQAPKVHSVTGKVTQVETGGKAFSLDISQGSDKQQPMHFVVDKNTTVQGHVAAGSMASVDYQADSGGQLVALSVKEESSKSQ
jgi:multidrug efflux pump subunit AcrA (membrane-fusion protein)